MTTIKTKLNSSDVLDKEFKIKPKGYDALEVDSFLDLIIEDYKTYEDLVNQFKMLQKTNSVLRNKITDLELEVETLNSKLGEYRNATGGANMGNIDLLKRISELEQQVYNFEQKEKKAKASSTN